MRFIHTSDWHLGKTIDGHSRIEEQTKFCEDFIRKVNENNIDLVIIAGDIYDTYNPPAEAEKLFYKTISSLASNGERCVLIISGNHDNPERLSAVMPLAQEQGIIILGNRLSKLDIRKYKTFEIVEAKEGCVKLKINDEKVVVITLPYPSENKLNEFILQNTYSEKIGELFKKLESNFEKDSINIAMSHIFVAGGECTDSERPIDKEGSLIVDKKDLPSKAQYIALGHLHKMQSVSQRLNAYYSGSPLQYSKDERMYTKGAYIVDIHPQRKANIEEIYFNNYKPIEVFTCDGIEEALKICEENKEREIWSYFEIKTDEVISQYNIKKMNEILKDIIEIKPIITSQYNYEQIDIKEKSMAEMFKEFYTYSRGLEPKGDLMNLFLDIINEEGEISNETN